MRSGMHVLLPNCLLFPPSPATFRVIQEPLFLCPILVSELTKATVSLVRLRTFLLEDELQTDAVQKVRGVGENGVMAGLGRTGGDVILVEKGTFTWGTKVPPAGKKDVAAAPAELRRKQQSVQDLKAEEKRARDKEDADRLVLKNLNVRVGRGQRVAICGTVGSGKSSVLGCILGEMTRLSGKVPIPLQKQIREERGGHLLLMLMFKPGV